jgi:hypothetical protein
MSSPSSGTRASEPRVPAGVRPGMAMIAFGLLLDVSEHSFVAQAPGAGAITPGQHGAHLVVLLGMVLILGAIVRDGVQGHGRCRPEGSPHDAVR